MDTFMGDHRKKTSMKAGIEASFLFPLYVTIQCRPDHGKNKQIGSQKKQVDQIVEKTSRLDNGKNKQTRSQIHSWEIIEKKQV